MLRACSVDEVGALAQTLGVSEITAGVLVRRGYADPALAASFLAGELPPHDPFLLGDMRQAVELIGAAVVRGARICVLRPEAAIDRRKRCQIQLTLRLFLAMTGMAIRC
jgi:hypothetical protein